MSDQPAAPTPRVRITKKLLTLLENPTVRSMSLDDMNPAIYNPRAIDADSAAGLMSSVTTFGMAELIVVNQRTVPATIVGGHRRYDVLRRAGARKTKVVVVDLSPVEEKALNVALNSSKLQGHFTDALRGILDEIKVEMPDLSSALRFDDLSKDLDDALAGIPQIGVGFGGNVGGAGGGGAPPGEDPGAQVDHAEELRVKWGVVLGQLWEIPSTTTPGRSHRLLCGDATKADDVALAMGGAVAALMVTDPPYVVSYADKNKFLNAGDRGNRNQTEIVQDHHTPDEMLTFWRAAWKAVRTALADDASYYMTGPQGAEIYVLAASLQAEGFTLKHMLIWAKNNHVLGRCDYHYKHEPILYGWLERHKWYGDSSQTSLWQIDKPTRSVDHPTMKPVELYTKAIGNSSKVGDVMVEPFSGSGTALVAAEQTGRLCCALEVEPRYVAVALERLSGMGLTPRFVTDGPRPA